MPSIYIHGESSYGSGNPMTKTGAYANWPTMSMTYTIGTVTRSGNTITVPISGHLDAQSGGSDRFGYSIAISASVDSGSRSGNFIYKDSYPNSWGSGDYSGSTTLTATNTLSSGTATLHIYMGSNCTCYSSESAREVWYGDIDVPAASATVTFNPNGGNWNGSTSYQKVTVSIGSNATISSNPTRDNYNFKEWNTKSDGSGTGYSGRTISSVQSDMTVYAQWTRITYQVTYKANGGSGSDYVDTVNSGASYSIKSASACGFSKTYRLTYSDPSNSLNPSYKDVSCTCSSWNTNSGGTGTSYSSGNTITVTEPLTLYAIWTNPTMGTLPTPTYDNAEFVGWFDGDGSSANEVTSSTVMTGNTTIYAHYNYYILYYYNADSTDGDGDDPATTSDLGLFTYGIKNHSVSYTITDSVPTVAQKAFSRWNTAKNGTGASYYSGDSYTTNAPLILYAQWDPGRYTVIFDANKGQFSDGSTQKIYTNVECGTGVTPPEDPTRKSHKFLGWMGNYTNVLQDTTIKAMWAYWPIWKRVKGDSGNVWEGYK